MKYVIDIPEEVYKKAKETHDVMCDSVWLGIKNGKPLDDVLVEIKEEIGCIQWFGDDAFWEGLNAVNEIINKHIRKE